jgi:hypothetical protein
MAIEHINNGAAPNDGTGDTIRDSWTKTNSNFTQLDNRTSAAQDSGDDAAAAAVAAQTTANTAVNNAATADAKAVAAQTTADTGVTNAATADAKAQGLIDSKGQPSGLALLSADGYVVGALSLKSGTLPTTDKGPLYNNGAGAAEWNATDSRYISVVPAHGQCRLALSAGFLKLSPYNGNKIIINGRVCTIPNLGVSLAATGLTVGAAYYIYVYESSPGVLALEAVSTASGGHLTSANGIEIKIGDPTRTLVGMGYIWTGPTWTDTDTIRGIASWFNRRRARADAVTSPATTSTVSTALVNPIYVFCWANEFVTGIMNGYVNNNGVGGGIAQMRINNLDRGTSVGFSGSSGAQYALAIHRDIIITEDSLVPHVMWGYTSANLAQFVFFSTLASNI